MREMNDDNRRVMEEFRAHRGKVGGEWENIPLLLLTTTGNKSGERRTTPITYMAEGDRLIVWASNGGEPPHPDWYHNLVVHPHVTVEVGTGSFDAIAVVTADAEWDRLWTQGVALYPQLAEAQAKTTRQIQVIALSTTSKLRTMSGSYATLVWRAPASTCSTCLHDSTWREGGPIRHIHFVVPLQEQRGKFIARLRLEMESSQGENERKYR
jgi:deazaflavin-dependent oxidoreductase (nitroreductase family)